MLLTDTSCSYAGNLRADIRGVRGTLCLHQDIQRRGEVRDTQARRLPTVKG